MNRRRQYGDERCGLVGRSSSGAALATLMMALPAVGQSGEAIAPAAAAYLAEAVHEIRSHAMWADSVDWGVVGPAVFDSAAGARVPVDTYRAIRFALRSLGDRHSFLQISEERRAFELERMRARGLARERPDEGSGPAVTSSFRGRRLPEGQSIARGGRALAHLVIPRSGALETTEFATRIHDLVRELDEGEPCGWVVDLRGNGGGNMWPMLAGLGPLLGAEVFGSFLGLDGVAGVWYYHAGASGMGGTDPADSFVGAVIAGEPHELSTDPAIAVLIDGSTGSSGEAVAIAFKGRPSTRFFGVPTAGVSTSTDGFRLPDGANLVITVGLDVDRTGRAYARDVVPDEHVPYDGGAEDRQLGAPLDWLERRPCG